jgi:hypothetical protein
LDIDLPTVPPKVFIRTHTPNQQQQKKNQNQNQKEKQHRYPTRYVLNKQEINKPPRLRGAQ